MDKLSALSVPFPVAVPVYEMPRGSGEAFSEGVETAKRM